jgi:hypothetical protein
MTAPGEFYTGPREFAQTDDVAPGKCEFPLVAEAVEEVRRPSSPRNDRIQTVTLANQSCHRGLPRESILRLFGQHGSFRPDSGRQDCERLLSRGYGGFTLSSGRSRRPAGTAEVDPFKTFAKTKGVPSEAALKRHRRPS